MLSQLEIKNYAIIQHVQIKFDKGLNIITGETGAGKSILLGALGLSLGDRADSKVLYQQTEKCIIEASFTLSNYKLEAIFEELDLDYEENTVIRREINPNGKSRAFVNDTPVTLENLRIIAEKLVNLTSQNETQQLNKEKYQLEIIDTTAENNELLAAYKTTFQTHQQLKRSLDKLLEEQHRLQNDMDFYSFQLQEIEEANLEGYVLEELEEELNSLNNAETIKEKLFALSNILENNDTSVLQYLRDGYAAIKEIAKFQKSYAELSERLNGSIIELEDLKDEAEKLADATEFDPERIEVLSTKVNEGNRLLRKHQLSDFAALIELRDSLKEKTASVTSNSVEIDRLEVALSKATSLRDKLGNQLSASRNLAKVLVKKEIEHTMQKVGMPNAVFDVSIEDRDNFTETGKDKVVFKFNANKGFEPQALHKIASGGELSRVLLSIQALLAKKAALPSLIFDEIDTGISGETAAKVAEVFREISQNHQLIAITHLPQIAARAEKHFFIYKNDSQEKTETKITALNQEQHIKAIARMLSGENISEESLNNARSLINI